MKIKSVERIIPKTKIFDIEFPMHIKRYEFAKEILLTQRVKGKILDLACGSGYGTTYLADFFPQEIVGVDIDKETILLAQDHYQNNNLDFQVMDAENLKFQRNSFEAVVSFETLEHVNDPEKLLSEIKKVLKSNGLLIISTPNKEITSPGLKKPKNPFHKSEFTVNEFQQILTKHFSSVQIMGQYLDQTLAEKRRLYDLVSYLLDGFESQAQLINQNWTNQQKQAIQKILKKLLPLKMNKTEGSKIVDLTGYASHLKKLIKEFYLSPAQSDIRIDRFHLEESGVLIAICR